MTLQRVRILSPNYSSRSGSAVRLIVIHTAEGATTYQSLGSFFQNPASQVSSHVGIDDTPNTVGEYVARDMKAWTAANANPVAVQAELCAFAAWTAATWNQHQIMLQNTAQWIAEEAAFFNIPLVRLTPAQAQSNGRGICGHVDLGSWGGNHTDPGPAFPMDQVIAMAQGGSEDDLPLNDADKQWITNTINNALRQQFNSGPPEGECYGRVRMATNASIVQNKDNYIAWAKQGAQQASS